MGWLEKLRGALGGKAAQVTEDLEIKELVHSYLVDPVGGDQWKIDVRAVRAGAVILDLPVERASAVIRSVLLGEIYNPAGQQDWLRRNRSEKLISDLSRRALQLTLEEAQVLLALHAEVQKQTDWPRFPALPKAIARSAQDGGWTDAIRPSFSQVREALLTSRWAQYAQVRKAVKEIELLITGAAKICSIESDAWGDKARATLDVMDAATRERWQAVLNYCVSAKGSAPSGKWLKAGDAVVEQFGKSAFAEHAYAWLDLLQEPAPKRDDPQARRWLLSESNGDLLKGLVWLLVQVPEVGSAAALRNAAIAAFRKIPNYGARSVKAGNACLQALKLFPGLIGARELAVLQATLKLPSQAAAVAKALTECAKRLNLSLAEIDELATSDHGFADGRRILQFGEFSAELRIESDAVLVDWRDTDGKARKAEPKQVKSEFAEPRKAMKRLIADVEKTLAAVRHRLERLPLETREWPVDTWQERYCNHAIVGPLTRRLIWRFRGESEKAALWLDGCWRDELGEPVDIAGTAVLPWHPVFASAQSVRNWRAVLSKHEVVQPFKQAHREIYLLTDAERNTRTYSNRFAAHVLRQHQFASLCLARGWRYRLQGVFDSHNTPVLRLPHWNLEAEFWVDAAGGNPDAGASASGIWLHVMTDQVRFRPMPREGASALEATEALALEDVPPIVLSEVMRDVDLFVGVTSVGNDPTWNDGGPDGRFRQYWHDYSFGALSIAAENRVQIIEELLPRLTLRDCARIDGKFLVVRGRLRTYKIHIGSGNILMEPNDQYLCIVADRSPRQPDAKLPFEGDGTLALILSKAFLLARDDQIQDASITRQIGVGL